MRKLHSKQVKMRAKLYVETTHETSEDAETTLETSEDAETTLMSWIPLIRTEKSPSISRT